MGGYYLYTNYIQPSYTTSQYSESQITRSQVIDKVKVEDTKCTIDGGYVDVQGYVKNIGDVLDTYNTYAVGGAGIAPNEKNRLMPHYITRQEPLVVHTLLLAMMLNKYDDVATVTNNVL